MNPCRIAVLISGSGSNLQALIDARSDTLKNGEIVLVISNNPEAYGLQRAQQAGVPTLVMDHRDYASREAFDAELARQLQEVKADLVVLAGYMRILSSSFVSQFQGRLLNIHPSLLPLYPGLHTHRRALEAADSEHGATVHFVTDELDGGPPVIQGRLQIGASDENELAERVQTGIEHHIYPLAVQWFVDGRLQFKDNGAYLDGELIPPTGIQWTNDS